MARSAVRVPAAKSDGLSSIPGTYSGRRDPAPGRYLRTSARVPRHTMIISEIHTFKYSKKSMGNEDLYLAKLSFKTDSDSLHRWTYAEIALNNHRATNFM